MVDKCVIFCAGEFDDLAQPLTGGEYVIAADGGLRYTQKLKIQPDLILGDFDSLGYVPAAAETYPVEKDDTDAMLAVKTGLNQGCREFLLYGGMDGPRIDHTVANFQTLRYLAERDCFGILVGKTYCAAVICGGNLVFPGKTQGGISVFCMGDRAEGVTLQGLYYPLDNGELTGGFPLGVSNHFLGQRGEIRVESGCLLVIWQKQAELPYLERRN